MPEYEIHDKLAPDKSSPLFLWCFYAQRTLCPPLLLVTAGGLLGYKRPAPVSILTPWIVSNDFKKELRIMILAVNAHNCLFVGCSFVCTPDWPQVYFFLTLHCAQKEEGQVALLLSTIKKNFKFQ